MENKASHNLILLFFMVLFIISCILLGWLFWPFISIIVIAAVVTGIFNPVYRAFKKRVTSSTASFFTCILIFFALFIPILLFVGVLANEAYELVLMAKGADLGEQVRRFFEGNKYLEKTNMILSNFNLGLKGDVLNKSITQFGKSIGLFFFEQANAIVQNMLKFFISFFLMLLTIYYFLIDKDRIISFIFDLSPLPDEQDDKLYRKFKDMAGAILIGNGLGGLIQGTLGGVIFAFLGFQSSFLWGFIMALMAFLPIVGIGVVFIPASVYLFLKGRIVAGIFLIVLYVILSGSIEYIFKPKLVGKRVQMHTLLVFFSIIGGLKLFGILGIIYGPLIVTAFLTLTDIYHASYQQLVTPEEKSFG